MNIQEIKNTLNYLLDNNLKLVEEGKGKLSCFTDWTRGLW